MKMRIKSMLGVTLLEVLLVLVIASLVLVMSIRYYQNASQSAKVNAAMEILTGSIAAADAYLSGGGSTATISATNLAPYLPNGAAPNDPWTGAPVSFTGGANSYQVGFQLASTNPACAQLDKLVLQNNKITGTCPTYTINP